MLTSIQPIIQEPNLPVLNRHEQVPAQNQVSLWSWFGKKCSVVAHMVSNKITHLFSRKIPQQTEVLDAPDNCLEHIFEYLNREDSKSARLTCRRFNTAHLTLTQKQAQNLYKMNALLSDMGITCPSSPEEAMHEIDLFIGEICIRLKEINSIIPENIQYREKIEDLVLNENQLKTFLETLYQYSLKKCFGKIAHTPLEMPLEEGSQHILAWLNDPENVKGITELSLMNLNIFCVPREIGKLTNLTELRLIKNQLKSIPAEIENLTGLTELTLHNNQLQSIPAEIGKLTNLTELHLSKNLLKSIPAEIGNLTNLNWLNLSKNQLKSIPTELRNLTNLNWLTLHDNPRLSIPEEISSSLADILELDE